MRGFVYNTGYNKLQLREPETEQAHAAYHGITQVFGRNSYGSDQVPPL